MKAKTLPDLIKYSAETLIGWKSPKKLLLFHSRKNVLIESHPHEYRHKSLYVRDCALSDEGAQAYTLDPVGVCASLLYVHGELAVDMYKAYINTYHPCWEQPMTPTQTQATAYLLVLLKELPLYMTAFMRGWIIARSYDGLVYNNWEWDMPRTEFQHANLPLRGWLQYPQNHDEMLLSTAMTYLERVMRHDTTRKLIEYYTREYQNARVENTFDRWAQVHGHIPEQHTTYTKMCYLIKTGHTPVDGFSQYINANVECGECMFAAHVQGWCSKHGPVGLHLIN